MALLCPNTTFMMGRGLNIREQAFGLSALAWPCCAPAGFWHLKQELSVRSWKEKESTSKKPQLINNSTREGGTWPLCGVKHTIKVENGLNDVLMPYSWWLKKVEFDEAASFMWPLDYTKKVLRQRLKSVAVPRLLQLCAVKSDDVIAIDGSWSFLHDFSPLETFQETVYLLRPLQASRTRKKNYLHPIPGSVKGLSKGLEQSGLVGGVPAHSRGLEQNNF